MRLLLFSVVHWSIDQRKIWKKLNELTNKLRVQYRDLQSIVAAAIATINPLTFCAKGHIVFVMNKRDGVFPDPAAADLVIKNENESTAVGSNANNICAKSINLVVVVVVVHQNMLMAIMSRTEYEYYCT